MKAAVLYNQADLRYEEIKTPSFLDDEILVQVKASGICGSDIPRVLGQAAHHYPIVLGHEFSGVVARVGEKVTQFKPGDNVVGVPLLPCHKCADCLKGHFAQCKHYSFVGSRRNGSWAQFVVMPERNLIKFDPELSFQHAAFIEPTAVALHAIRQVKFESGHHAVIIGAGTIGLLLLQWLVAFGATSVTVIDINEARLELARQCGATTTINAKHQNVEHIKHTFSYVFEAAGSAVTIKQAFELVSNKGKICYVGTPTTPVEFSHQQFELMNRKEFFVTGSWMSYSAPFPGEEWTTTLQFMKKNTFLYELLIDKILPLSQASDAFMLYKNNQVNGKIILISE